MVAAVQVTYPRGQGPTVSNTWPRVLATGVSGEPGPETGASPRQQLFSFK